MSEIRFSENDLGGPGRWLGGAQGTQRKALGGSGFHISSAGQLAPLLPTARASSVLASVKKQEVAGRRDPEPRKVSQCSATRKDRAGCG